MSAFTLFRAHKTPEGGWGAYALRKLSGQSAIVSAPDVDHAIETAASEITAAADKFVGDHAGQFAPAIQAQVHALVTALATMAEVATDKALAD